MTTTIRTTTGRSSTKRTSTSRRPQHMTQERYGTIQRIIAKPVPPPTQPKAWADMSGWERAWQGPLRVLSALVFYIPAIIFVVYLLHAFMVF